MKRTNLPALILLLLLCTVSQGAFRFVAWADNRPYDATNEARFIWMLQQMNVIVGSEPLFHVVPGDYDDTYTTNEDIQTWSDIKTWHRAPGNHDGGDSAASNFDVPGLSGEDPPQARFLFLDQYQCPDSVSGCDCSMGRVCSHALVRLEIECESAPGAPGEFPIFVIGHEPAFPQYRHVGDSLDLPLYLSDRDAFWALLGYYGATYICGHTHFYSEYSSGGATQIDVGNAGNPGDSKQTFVVFTVNDDGSVSRTTHQTEYNVSPYPPATNPLPADGATGLSTTPVLSWTAGTGATSHKVYFGTFGGELSFACTVIPPEFSRGIKELPGYSEGLEYKTQYVWRVDELFSDGHITQGSVWTFETKEELAVRYAVGETTVDGSVSGDIDGTERREDVYEILTETLNVPNKNGYGALEHIWQFNNIPTGTNLQFRIEAHRSAFDIADDFIMSYSTNGSTFLPFVDGLSITNTNDGNSEVIRNLDSGIDGTIWVKVKNTDQIKGSQDCGTLYVDCMYFVSSDEIIPDDVVLPESGNQPPVANAGADQTITDAEGDGEIVTVDGSASYDPDGTDLLFEWTVNGSVVPDATGAMLTQDFNIGTHTVGLKVTDIDDSSDTDQVTITVQAAGSTMHVHDIEMSSKAAGPNNSGIVTVWIQDTSDADVEGATVSGTWSGIVGGAASSVTGVDGKVTLQSPKVKSGGTFTFTVDNVVKSGWTYDPTGETSGSITVP